MTDRAQARSPPTTAQARPPVPPKLKPIHSRSRRAFLNDFHMLDLWRKHARYQRRRQPPPRRLSQRLASLATFFGAVPPRLVRLSTERPTESTLRAAWVMRGSITCRTEGGSA